MEYDRKACLVVSALLLLPGASNGQDSPRTATPERATPSDAAQELADIGKIEDALVPGEWLATQDTLRLRGTLVGKRWTWDVRQAAFSLLCRKVDLHDGDGVVDTLVAVSAQQPSQEETRLSMPTFGFGIFSVFFSNYARKFQTRLEHPELLLDLYVSFFEENSQNGIHFMQPGAYELISKSPASLEQRQTCLVRIAARNGTVNAPPTLYSLMDEGVARELRKFALGDNTRVHDWNRFALGLLADYGDLETAEMIREAVIAYGEDPVVFEQPGTYIWLIRARRTPKILLDFLQSHKRGPDTRSSRASLLDTAVRWGLDRDAIAAAVRKHANDMGKPGCTYWNDYIRLRSRCIEHGILKNSELRRIPERFRSTVEMMRHLSQRHSAKQGDGTVHDSDIYENTFDAFFIYNSVVVTLLVTTLLWRTRDWRSMLWAFPLAALGDSEMKTYIDVFYRCGSEYPAWRAVWMYGLTPKIIASSMMTVVSVVLYRSYSPARKGAHLTDGARLRCVKDTGRARIRIESAGMQ